MGRKETFKRQVKTSEAVKIRSEAATVEKVSAVGRGQKWVFWGVENIRHSDT